MRKRDRSAKVSDKLMVLKAEGALEMELQVLELEHPLLFPVRIWRRGRAKERGGKLLKSLRRRVSSEGCRSAMRKGWSAVLGLRSSTGIGGFDSK